MPAQQPQQYGAFGSAPSMGNLQVTTGIPYGGSSSPEQLAALHGIFGGLGTKPGTIGPYAPSVRPDTPQQQSVSDSYKMLTRQQGAQKGNEFANTVNQNEAQLRLKEAEANSQIGNKMQDFLANQYAFNTGQQADLNSALVGNQVRNKLLLTQLLGSLLGGVGGLGGEPGGLGSMGGLGGADQGPGAGFGGFQNFGTDQPSSPYGAPGQPSAPGSKTSADTAQGFGSMLNLLRSFR